MIRSAARAALGMVLLAAPAAAQPAPAAEPVPTPAPTTAPATPKPAPAKLPTPNAERVLVIGVLDKVSSETRDLTLKPGETARFGKLRIAARTCEASPPWQRPHTGAFLQIDGPARDNKLKRLFSGWLFAESPSLNSFDNERYDVWVRSCAMRFPETGPRTVVVGKSAAPVTTTAPAQPERPAN